ncbi:MAG: hypothetical protein QHC67_16230 [Sphingobium sp.]|uniref:hypothetical protein n=1 Tax=Sphingobium sp. TaxID=1912891 RepID=UPI0029A15AB8|nr:hypothetical protein [Sphingobium sp.]MDX3911344.1 hypothetical protein [Sphingobium sp.]
MHIIRSWAELDEYLDRSPDPDIASLLQARRLDLFGYGDLPDVGTFNIVQPGDSLEGIEATLRLSLTVETMPTWEWIKRRGSIFEAPIILSDDGFGHVLIIPDAEGIDPRLLALCREHV